MNDTTATEQFLIPTIEEMQESDPIRLFEESYSVYLSTIKGVSSNDIKEKYSDYYKNGYARLDIGDPTKELREQQNIVLLHTLSQVADHLDDAKSEKLIVLINQILDEDPALVTRIRSQMSLFENEELANENSLQYKLRASASLINLELDHLNTEDKEANSNDQNKEAIEARRLEPESNLTRLINHFSKDENKHKPRTTLAAATSTAISALPFPLNALMSGSLTLLSGHPSFKIFKARSACSIAAVLSRVLTSENTVREKIFNFALNSLLLPEEQKLLESI